MSLEELAKKMYDTYCEAVGGKAYDGSALVGSEEFFADPTKFKQVNAWRVTAAMAMISVAPVVNIENYTGNITM